MTNREALIALAEGKKVRGTCWGKEEYIVICPDGLFDENAELVSHDFGSDEYEIYEEPFVLDFDWDSLPKWADRYVAMNKNGEWMFYNEKPLPSDKYNEFTTQEKDEFSGYIDTKYFPKNFTGSWEDSLYENPKYAK